MQMKKRVKKILSIICLILGSFFSLYVGAWLMLIKPIHFLITSFSGGTLEMKDLIACIIKIAFSTTFAGLVWCVGYIGYNHFIGTEDPDWEQLEAKYKGKEKDSDS